MLHLGYIAPRLNVAYAAYASTYVETLNTSRFAHVEAQALTSSSVSAVPAEQATHVVEYRAVLERPGAHASQSVAASRSVSAFPETHLGTIKI